MNDKEKTINCIVDYLEWIKGIGSVVSDNDKNISFDQRYVYYRGQACCCWDWQPSVFRGDTRFDEHSLLLKAKYQSWNEIAWMKTYLEKMVFFQHYGLATRLLDITFNPLVALYVACCENQEKKDGYGVVRWGYLVYSCDFEVAELTAEYVFENDVNNALTNFQNFIKDKKVNPKQFTRPIFIYPPMNNPRIEAQRGAFIMAPLFSRIEKGHLYLNRKGFEKSRFFDECEALIPNNKKESILQELSTLGIDCGTIYGGIEGKLKAIMDEERRNKIVIQN